MYTDIYVNERTLVLMGWSRKRKRERKKARPYLVQISECDHAPEVLKTIGLIFTKFSAATYHPLLLVLFPLPHPPPPPAFSMNDYRPVARPNSKISS